MKKIIFSILCIAYSLTGLGQRLALSSAVNITRPNGMVELSQNEVSSFAKQRLHNKKTLQVDNNGMRNYTVNNILVSLHSENGVVEPEHLLKLKKGLDAMSSKDKAYTSEIVTVNNNQVLITLSGGGQYIRYYDFFCFNKANTSAISGVLQFNDEDQAEAKTVLDDILNSIKFTD